MIYLFKPPVVRNTGERGTRKRKGGGGGGETKTASCLHKWALFSSHCMRLIFLLFTPKQSQQLASHGLGWSHLPVLFWELWAREIEV